MTKLTTYFFVFAWLCYGTALAQIRVEVNDKAAISVKVVSYNEQLIHFQTLTGTLDSIPTEQVSRIAYGDSLQVLVFPQSMKGKRQLLTQTQFLEAMQASDYATLFHAYTHLYDVQFAATKGALLLTSESRLKLAPLIRMLKMKQALHLTIAVHADSVGKTPTNQLLTERRAKVLSAELLRNGIAPGRFTMQAKGESEPFLIRPSLSRRIEITVDKIAKTKVLYAQKYVTPPPPKPVEVATPPKPKENKQKPTQTTQMEEEDEPNYRYWTLTVGGEAVQLLASQSPQWADEQVGMGLKLGVGGSVQFTKQFSNLFGVIINVGYRHWEVERKYMLNGEQLYTSSDKLTQFPLQLGFRTFLFRGIYIAPQANVVLTKLLRTTDEANPISSLNQLQQTFYMGASGTLGYELLGERLVIDFGLTYSYLPKVTQKLNFYTQMNDPLHLIGFKITTGIRSKTH